MISSLFKKLYNWSYTILSNTLANTEMTDLGRQSLWHISSRQEMCQTTGIIKKIA